jgi:D-alanyl-D-alanine dipeptidase
MKKFIIIIALLLFSLNSCTKDSGKRPVQQSNNDSVEVQLINDTGIVNAEKLIPEITLDIRYATENNFTGKKVYDKPFFFLRKEAAEKLKAANNEFLNLGYRIKVFDGYRPLSVQRKFWEIMPDEKYVANPEKGSRHNRGAAVDITLTDLNGIEIPMPTEYDDFSEKAHRDYMDLPKEKIRNRKLLEDIMHKHGFTGLPTEWWHFDLDGWEKYSVIDVDLRNVE